MMRELASDPFEIVARSFVAPKHTVVLYKFTLSGLEANEITKDGSN